jgi:uncharacterized protein (DUF2141 family)
MNELHAKAGRHPAMNQGEHSRRRLLHAAAALAWAMGNAPGVAMANASGTGTLTLQASGFTHAGGRAVAKLFIPGDNVLEAGRWQQTAAIDRGDAVFRFEGLAAGTYAAVVFHDENSNGVIDHGLLGPSEPLGFSGGFVLSLLSGRPDFERLKFDFKPPAQRLEVSVR